MVKEFYVESSGNNSDVAGSGELLKQILVLFLLTLKNLLSPKTIARNVFFSEFPGGVGA